MAEGDVEVELEALGVEAAVDGAAGAEAAVDQA